MQILVIFPLGHIATIEAEGYDTVDTFIKKLFIKEFESLRNIAEFNLFFGEERLDTKLDKKLREFNIQEDSRLNLGIYHYGWDTIKKKRLLIKRLNKLEEKQRRLEPLITSIVSAFEQQRGGHISKRKKRKTKRRKKGK